MAGKIRTNERCPACRSVFKETLGGRGLELVCPSCHIRPSRFFIDARPFGAGKIYKDKRGLIFDSYLAAHRQLEEMRAQVDRHTFDATQWVPAKQKEFKFENEVGRWIASLRQDRSAAYSHSCDYWNRREFIPYFAGIDVRDIRTSHIEEFYRYLLTKEYAPKTVWTILTSLRAFFRRLHDQEIIEKAPKFPKVIVPDCARGWLNREKQTQVISLIPEFYRLAFELLAESAIRPGELCALKKKDLMDGELVIERAFDQFGNLRSTKTGRVIYKSLSPTMWEKLTTHAVDLLPEAWLFTRKDGSPHNVKSLYFQWRYACKKVGIKISLYAGTRRSRASQKRLELEKGMGETLRQELGHSTSVTTMRSYARDRREEI